MPDKLPKGWVKTTLGEVCSRVETVRPEDTPNAEFTYFDIGGIDNQRNQVDSPTIIFGRSAPSRARLSVRKDDILFSTVRTNLKNIACIEEDYLNPVASTGFAVIRAREGVVPRFVFYQVLSERFLAPIHLLQSGSSYPAVRDRDVFAQPFLLPPSAEQERIAAKLTASLLGMERAEKSSRRAQERLRDYEAAVLHEAVTGTLTREWRKSRKSNETGPQLLRRLLKARRSQWDQAELNRLKEGGTVPKNDKWKTRYRDPIQPTTDSLSRLPKGWARISIDGLAWNSGYGTSVKCTREANGPAVLRIPNIRDRALNFKDMKFATSSRDFSAEDFVAPGDMLLVRTNGSRNLIGRVAVVKTAPKQKCSFASYLIRFRLVGNETIWSWVSLAWDSDILRSSIESRAKTTAGQYNVSLSGLANLALPLPPIDEQIQITREVDRRLSAANQLAATLNRQLDQARLARQSLLQDAFDGRLLPQNPTEESANILLDRIRHAREIEAKKPKGKRMSKSKSKTTRRSLLDVFHEHKKPMTPEQLFHEAGFQPAQADLFYRELTSLRKLIREKKPPASGAKVWPQSAHVLLELKES